MYCGFQQKQTIHCHCINMLRMVIQFQEEALSNWFGPRAQQLLLIMCSCVCGYRIILPLLKLSTFLQFSVQTTHGIVSSSIDTHPIHTLDTNQMNLLFPFFYIHLFVLNVIWTWNTCVFCSMILKICFYALRKCAFQNTI